LACAQSQLNLKLACHFRHHASGVGERKILQKNFSWRLNGKWSTGTTMFFRWMTVVYYFQPYFPGRRKQKILYLQKGPQTVFVLFVELTSYPKIIP